jgi:hypothetical protein
MIIFNYNKITINKMEATAVEWLEGYLKKFNHITESLSLTKAFEQAKKLEAKQKNQEYQKGMKDANEIKVAQENN